MGAVIRQLSGSRLADSRIAIIVSGTGLLLGMILGAAAPNVETSTVALPLSHLLPSLGNRGYLPVLILYAGDALACAGLAGLLWAYSQGWTPDPRRLLLASSAVVAVMVNLAPVGSSDVGSYAAYGDIAAHGGNPYLATPRSWGDAAYLHVVGGSWTSRPSVYGPVATALQAFAARIGGQNVSLTVWVLMLINGAAFIGTGYVLLKTSDDPVRATLCWTANPVLLQQLVGGGHVDTLVAGTAICAVQASRRAWGARGDVLTGVLLGLACGIKINGALIALGLGWALLHDREVLRAARVALAAAVTLAAEYSFYASSALKPLAGAATQVTLPSPWRLVQIALDAAGVPDGTVTDIIKYSWPIAMLVVAWYIRRQISDEQPLAVVAPFALAFAWVLTAPWVLAWYTALAWVVITQIPRNRMTRWLTIVTIVLALWLSNGGHGGPT